MKKKELEQQIIELKSQIFDLERENFQLKAFEEIGDKKLLKAYEKVDTLIKYRNELLVKLKLKKCVAK